MTSITRVNCPTCGKDVPWSDDAPYRPFCSKRCKQLDFGDWVLEKHSIPGEEAFIPGEEDPERDR